MSSDYIVDFPGLGIEGIELNRVAFNLFGIQVYWYGLFIAIAVLLTMFLATREAKKFHLDEDYILDNFLVIIPGMIIGARLYYVLFTWDLYKDDWKSIFDTRKGGLAFYGGVIGGLVAILIYHWIKKKRFEPLADFLVVYIPLGQAIGRLGNFVNQEAFGTNTSLPWGMISNGTKEYLASHPELGQDPNLPVHPTFLYEFIGNMILFVILHRFRKSNKIPYGTFSLYIIGYGLIRFFVEGMRTDSLYIQGTDIRVSQLLSAVMVVAGILYLILLRNKKRKAVASEEDELLESFANKKENKTEGATKEDKLEIAEAVAVSKDVEASLAKDESKSAPDADYEDEIIEEEFFFEDEAENGEKHEEDSDAAEDEGVGFLQEESDNLDYLDSDLDEDDID